MRISAMAALKKLGTCTVITKKNKKKIITPDDIDKLFETKNAIKGNNNLEEDDDDEEEDDDEIDDEEEEDDDVAITNNQEMLLVLLYRLSSCDSWIKIEKRTGIEYSRISRIFKVLINKFVKLINFN